MAHLSSHLYKCFGYGSRAFSVIANHQTINLRAALGGEREETRGAAGEAAFCTASSNIQQKENGMNLVAGGSSQIFSSVCGSR